MGMFETYVYTKETFDPAPRIFQECKYYKKDVIYLRDKDMKDGGSVYWKRDNNVPDINIPDVLHSLLYSGYYSWVLNFRYICDQHRMREI